MSIQGAFAVPAAPAPAAPAAPENALYFDLKGLTFTGSTAVAGLLVGFLASWAVIPFDRVFIALIVALAFGIGITVIGVTNPNQVSGVAAVVRAIVLGVFNTLVLWMSITGVSTVLATTTP